MPPSKQDILDKWMAEGRLHICDCGEEFDIAVWHCPLCGHHWQMHVDECRNCHKGLRDGPAPRARNFNDLFVDEEC